MGYARCAYVYCMLVSERRRDSMDFVCSFQLFRVPFRSSRRTVTTCRVSIFVLFLILTACANTRFIFYNINKHIFYYKEATSTLYW